jgi:hypothetical protein
MRNVRLWRGLLGVDKRTVIEDVEFSEEGAERGRAGGWRGCGHEAGFRAAAGVVSARRPGMTAVRADAGDGAWIGARCRWCWRPMRRG